VKVIKLAILSFLFLFLIVFGISLFIPSHIRISRAVNLKSSADSVLAEISDMNKWKEWYPGFDTLHLDPLSQENGRLVSAKLSATIISITDARQNEVKAEFKSGNKRPVISGWEARSYNHSDSLTLQWYLDFKLKWYPWEKFFSLAYDKMYGTQMEEGLRNLKKNIEH
jgi:polyketide cyclase/dehydrase/lipid transport protein